MFNYITSSLNLYFSRRLFFFFTTLSLFFLLVIDLFEGLEILRKSIGKVDIPIYLILKMVLLKTPYHFQKLLPVFFFISCIVTFWRLKTSREILACRALGTSLWQFVIGLSIVPLGITFIYLVVLNPLSAVTFSHLNKIQKKLFNLQSEQIAFSNEGIWFQDYYKDSLSFIHSDKHDMKKNLFYTLTFYIFKNKNCYLGRIEAEKGYIKEGKWHLFNVNYWDKTHTLHYYAHYKLWTSLSLEGIKKSYNPPDVVSFWQLPFYISKMEENGFPSGLYRLAWHSHTAKGLFLLSMLFLSTVLCLENSYKQNIPRLIILSLIIGFLIHFFKYIIHAFGMAEKISPLIAVWFVPILVLLMSTAMLLHYEDGR